ncbi:MAG TPA: TMEM175 family protein [Acidimicrobiales bacterium]|nr:TMEM175 family protein [Acidimicrobiales bacterium]
MSPSRLETFSDGVFAIAATLLILDVHTGAGHLGADLRHIWPSYAAYAVSFLTIGIIWINHHTVFAQIHHVDRLFLLINVAFLMTVAFIPFPTSLIASQLRGGDLEPAALTYGATLTITAIFFNILWFYASSGDRLLRKDADPRVVSGISRSFRPGPFIYLIATLCALFSPIASVILFGLITVFYIVESSIFGRSAGQPSHGGRATSAS